MSEEKQIETADCCKRCEYCGEDGECRAQGKHCMRWRIWFSKEWAKIREAAARLKRARS